MATLKRLFDSRAPYYFLLLALQAFLIYAGVVGSACHSQSSPTPVYEYKFVTPGTVINTETASPDGGPRVTSRGGPSVIFPRMIKLNSVPTDVIWAYENTSEVVKTGLSIDVTNDADGNVLLQIEKGKAAKSATVTMVARSRKDGRIVQRTPLRVQVE